MLHIEWNEEDKAYKAKCDNCGGSEEGSTDTSTNAEAMVRAVMKRHETCSPSSAQGDE